MLVAGAGLGSREPWGLHLGRAESPDGSRVHGSSPASFYCLERSIYFWVSISIVFRHWSEA